MIAYLDTQYRESHFARDSIGHPSSQGKDLALYLTDIIKLLPLLSFIRSKSYSQFWEDRLIDRVVINKIGSYVDVGAGSPVWASNTYLFYKRGWQGVTVEPILFNYIMQKLIRRRDLQIRALVTDTQTQMDFYQLWPWELSTTIQETAKSRISEGATLIRKEKIDCISLSEIYGANPISRPAILSIDVEGAELEVLQSNNWKQFIPDLICIEELTSPIQSSTIREFLEGQGYRLQAHNGVSSIYVWLDSTCLK